MRRGGRIIGDGSRIQAKEGNMPSVTNKPSTLDTAIEELAASIHSLVAKKAKAIDHPADGLRLRIWAYMLLQEAESVED
jgi:hypothetical protein